MKSLLQAGSFLIKQVTQLFLTSGHTRASGRDLSRGPLLLRYAFPFLFSVVLLALLFFFVRKREQLPGTVTTPAQAGRIEKQLVKIDLRLKDNPDDISALLESGLYKFQKGQDNYIAAITDLENARAKGAVDIRIFYTLGVMYQAVGLYDFAAQEYQRYLNNKPGDFETLLLLAKLQYASGKYPLAVKAYEDLQAVQPENLIVLENLALSRWKNKQDPKPILDIMSAQGEEALFRTDYISGLMAYESGAYTDAVKFLERAASGSAGYPGFSDRALIYKMLSDSYIKIKAEDKAIAALTELLTISPSDDAKAQLARLTKNKQRSMKHKK